MKLLIVEDEKDLREVIAKTLEAEGYVIDACSDGRDAVHYIMSETYDAVILDVMIPGIDGFEVLKKIRRMNIEVPVLFLTARDRIEDIVYGLDHGADDYMIKPFSFEELMARIRVITRRQPEIHENVYRCGDLSIDANRKTVSRQGKEIPLSPKEYAILEYLARNKNIVVSRAQISSNIWSIDFDGESNVIDVYIRYLRKKIDDDYDTKLIQTVRGMGYTLRCDD